MRVPFLLLGCLTVARVCVCAQFEAASVKPAPSSASGISCSGGPGTSSPGLWRCSNVPLSFLISQAYGFQAYQFPPSAPCCRERVDISAKVPPGSTKEQFHQTMQALLVERFHLKLHHEQKEMTVFELTVGPKGVKMKESAPDASAEPEDPWTPPASSVGKDGYPVFPPGRGGVAGFNGRYRWTGFSLSMAEIARTLSFHLGGPVIDATGLKAKYDIDMIWNIDLAAYFEMAGRRDLAAELPPDDGARGPTLLHAVPDQLGLKLTAKKGTGDVVVVDHVDKVPVEN